MKKNLTLIALLTICSFAQAQEDDNFKMPKALIKIYPQQFFVNTFQLGIETFNPTFSRSFNFDVGLRTQNNNWDASYSGVYSDIAYRKYFVPMKLSDRVTRKYYMGVYYSIGFKAGYYKTETYDEFNGNYYEDIETEFWSLSPSFTIGIQKTIWQVLVLDMFVGGAVGIPIYQANAVEVSYPTIVEPAFKGIYPKIGVKIGVGL